MSTDKPKNSTESTQEPETLRLGLKLGPEATREIEEMRQNLGVSSSVEVVKHALGQFQLIQTLRMDGWRIVAERDGERKILLARDPLDES